MASEQRLSWPAGWARTNAKDRVPSRFGRGEELDLHNEQEKLLYQLALLKAKDIKISSDLTLRADGTPKIHQPALKDPGIAVYFKLEEDEIVLACDRWPTIEENMAATRSHINALRGMDRWGVGKLEQAFRGYIALPAPASENWQSLLGNPRTLAEAEAAYRSAMRVAHPDNGGTSTAAAALNNAIKVARDTLK